MKSILLIRLSSLGDIVITTSLIKSIRTQFPETEITFLVFEKYKDLLKNNPNIDRLITFDYKANPIDLYRAFKIIIKLRKKRFDVLIDLHANNWCLPRTIFWTFIFRSFINCKIKIKVKGRSFKNIKKNMNNGAKKSYHILDMYKKSLLTMGGNKFFYNPEIYISQCEKESANNYLSQKGVKTNELLIGISSGASHLYKQWPEQKFIELCKKLTLNDNIKIILFGDLKDKKIIDRISIMVNSKKIILATDLTLLLLASIISQCKVFITNDSGPMHIATAVKAPVIAIFGPTHPILGFAPLGENNKVFYSNISCSPCSRWGERKCRYKEQLCFRDTQVDDILNAMNRFIEIDFKNKHHIELQTCLNKNP